MRKIFLSLLAAQLLMYKLKAQDLETALEHLYNERYESAKSILQQEVVDNNIATDARYWLAEVYLKDGDITSAEKIVNAGIENTAKMSIEIKEAALLYAARAHLLLDQGKKEEAHSQMEDLLKQKKYKDVTALLAVANINIESKNGDTYWAIELLEKAIKRDKQNAVLYISLGDAYRKLLEGGKAVTAYKEAVNIDNKKYQAVAYHKIGEIYKTQENTQLYTEYFNKALIANPTYAPSLYEMYTYYYYRDVSKAKIFLERYIANADPSLANDYMMADLFYVSEKYKEAIQSARMIIKKEDSNVSQPRIYKLLAYSYHFLHDSINALHFIDLYFEKEKPENFVAKDFELKAELLVTAKADDELAIEWYKKAIDSSEQVKDKIKYMNSIAGLERKAQNFSNESYWREAIFKAKENPSNLDLYRWGIALYSGAEYKTADSVFALYEEKYPEHLQGYLMRARCNALIDTSMELGLAVPHYKKLIEEALKDSIANKATLIRAFGYLGSYEANITKDYRLSLEYFDKILALEPGNSDALRYAGILKKWIGNDKNEVK